MENEIIKSENTTSDYEKMAIDYLRGMGMTLPAKYENQFIEMCKAFGLNPYKRECYAVGYGDNWNIITGYEVYIKRAERTGKLDGWSCKVEGTGSEMKAVITIYRKDWKEPFVHYVLFDEAVQRKKDGGVTSVWQKMPSFMLRKVAIAQGFRLCFPDELGGLPYTSDEVVQEEINVTPPKAEIDEETEKLKSQVADYLTCDILTGGYAKKAKMYLDTNDKQGLKKVVEYVEASKM